MPRASSWFTPGKLSLSFGRQDSRSSGMNQRLAILALFLMLGSAGCGGTQSPQPAKEQRPPSPKEQAKDAAPDVESYGHLGQSSMSSGEQRYQCALPHWQKNKRVLFLGVVEYPGRPLGPAYFVLVRLPPDYSGSSFAANPSINH